MRIHDGATRVDYISLILGSSGDAMYWHLVWFDFFVSKIIYFCFANVSLYVFSLFAVIFWLQTLCYNLA